MSKPITFSWPEVEDNGICLLQTKGSAGNLIINGTLAKNTPNGYNAVVFPNGILRTVGITSSDNNSGINFTITGTNQGNAQTETIAGPNIATVYTTKLFDSVTSVSVSGATVGGGVSVGTGVSGTTDWLSYNYHASVSALSVAVKIIDGSLTYSFEYTLDDVNTNSSPAIYQGIIVPNPASANAFRLAMSSATVSDFAYLNYPLAFYRLNISSATGSFVVSFAQQGID